jgi:hypothetical protein
MLCRVKATANQICGFPLGCFLLPSSVLLPPRPSYRMSESRTVPPSNGVAPPPTRPLIPPSGSSSSIEPPTPASLNGDAALQSNKIYIGGLPESTRTEDLQDCFSQIGPLVKVDLKLGFGFVVRIITQSVGVRRELPFFVSSRSCSTHVVCYVSGLSAKHSPLSRCAQSLTPCPFAGPFSAALGI